MTTFFTNASDIITMFLIMNDESDENNCVSSEDFEITSDDVDESYDEIQSKKKTTRVVF